jgi:proteic killer suppression protein
VAILSFKDKETEFLFREGIVPRKKGWAGAHKIAKRKLDMLHYAGELKDLLCPPGNKLESLSGD